MSNELDLFDGVPEVVPPMVRMPDLPASILAKNAVEWSTPTLRNEVLRHIRLMQPVTALELEELEIFESLAPSTIRKRVSELKFMGRITTDGVQQYTTIRGRMTTAHAWRAI